MTQCSRIAVREGVFSLIAGWNVRLRDRNRTVRISPVDLTGSSLWILLLSTVCLLGLPGCNDVSKAPDPEPGPGALAIASPSLPDGVVNQPYATSVGGSGGITPYLWSVDPPLPRSLVLDSSTGAISGTPETVGTSTHTFTLRDSSNPAQATQISLPLTINAAPAVLAIATTSLPAGNVGQPYSRTIQATGGTPPFSWSIAAGSLPQNLGFNFQTGLISGTPTAVGTSAFTVRVTDTTGQADTQSLSILINPSAPPNITSTSPLPGATVGLPYSQTLTAAGGTGSLVWSRTIGSLPANLTLNPAGIISGTPTNTGTSAFTLRVTDALSQSDTQQFSLTVSAALTITTNSLDNARVRRSYDETLQQAGGTAPFTWSVSPPLPAELVLNAATGNISGTPTSTSNVVYSFTVRDSSSPTNQTFTKSIRLRVTN